MTKLTGYKYIVDIGITSTAAPGWAILLRDLGLTSGGFILGGISLMFEFTYRKLTGIDFEQHDRSIVIYRKPLTVFKRRQLVYEEHIPAGVEEYDVSKLIYRLEKEAKKGELNQRLVNLLSGKEKLFDKR